MALRDDVTLLIMEPFREDCRWRCPVAPDKQISIPGLEPLLSSPPSRSRRPKRPAWPADQVAFLEKRISALEVDLSILKIQMEKDYA